LFGAENMTLRKVDRKYLGSFEISAGEGQMDKSYEKRSITKRQRGEECPRCNYKKVGKIYWS